jgi:hypothetical protein
MESWQWGRNVAKVTDVPRSNNEHAREAISLGGIAPNPDLQATLLRWRCATQLTLAVGRSIGVLRESLYGSWNIY